jgi:putative transposase
VIYSNEVFHDREGRRIRILSVDANGSDVWTISLDANNPMPVPTTLAQMESSIAAGDLTRAQSTEIVAPVRPSSRAAKKRDDAWSRIEPLLRTSAIFAASTRKQLVSERAAQTGNSITTVYGNLRAYWLGGQTRDALLPRYHKPSVPTEFSTRNRGRKPTDEDYKPFQLHPRDIENIRRTYKRYYLNDEFSTHTQAHRRMRMKYYSYTDGNQKLCLRPPGEFPSLRQFRYHVVKLFPREEVLRLKLGDKAFEKDHAPRLGTMLYGCQGVGHIYEIDSTVADYLIVSRETRSRIVGKPTLFLIYDRESRLAVGFYVGLEYPTWETAMQAILSIAEDKAALCHKYGVEYDPEDWPADKVFPAVFLADRGEMLSGYSDNICTGMNSTVQNTPALAPQRKGTVEVGIKLIQRSIADEAPGFQPPQTFGRRRSKHYDKDACATLDEFISIILAAIIAHNRSLMKGYERSVDQVNRAVPAIPRVLWADGIVRRSGVLPRFTPEYLRLKLLPQAKATVTDKGIFLRGCYYSCPEALKRGWFLSETGRGRFKVEASFDRRLVDNIYVYDPQDRSKYFLAELTDRSKKYVGYSFDEVADLERADKQSKRDWEEATNEEKVRRTQHIDAIARRARTELKKQHGSKSRSARKADIREDRDNERRERRQEDASLRPKRATTPTPNGAEVIQFPSKKSTDPITDTGHVEPPTEAAHSDSQSSAEMLRQLAQELMNDK